MEYVILEQIMKMPTTAYTQANTVVGVKALVPFTAAKLFSLH